MSASASTPRELETPAGRLALTDEGPADAPALVCFHGSPGSHRDCRHLAPLLAGPLRVLRLDLPGFGNSPVPEGFDPTLVGRAAILPALLDTLGLERAAVLGHSMGGGIATAAAVRYPDRVSALVLLASAGPRPHRGIRALSPLQLNVILAGIAIPGVRDLLLPRLRDAWRRARFPGADQMPLEAFRFQLSLVRALDFDGHRERLGRVSVPTLVAWAEDDHLIEPAVSRELFAAIPGARPLIFPTGGHNLQKTQAESVAAAILDLLAPRGEP